MTSLLRVASTEGKETALFFGGRVQMSVLEVTDYNEVSNVVEELLKEMEIKPERKRWVILLLFWLAGIINSMIWLTFASVPSQTMEFYSLSGSFWVNYMSLIFFLMYVPVVFVSSWVLDQSGLRAGIICGVIFSSGGALIRCLGYSPKMFVFTCIGQTISAIGQPFLQNAPTKVAIQWFPDNERGLATSIASLSNPIGGSIGMILSPTIMTFFPDDIWMVLLIEAIASVSIMIAVIVFFESRPKSPPSRSAVHQQLSEEVRYSRGAKLTEFKQSLIQTFSNRNFLILFVIYSVNLAVFQGMATLVNQVMAPYGYSPIQSSLTGGLSVLFGIVGSIAMGKVMGKYRHYKLFLFIFLACAWFINVLWTSLLWPNLFVLLFILGGFVGLCIVPIFPIVIVLISEITYPLPEATPVGFSVMGGMLWSAIEILIIGYFLESGYIHFANILFGSQYAVCYILLWFFKGELKISSFETGFYASLFRPGESISTTTEDEYFP